MNAFLGETGNAWARCNYVCVTVEPVSSMYTPFQQPSSPENEKYICKDDMSHNSLIVYGPNKTQSSTLAAVHLPSPPPSLLVAILHDIMN
jgi:hypothetical protein